MAGEQPLLSIERVTHGLGSGPPLLRDVDLQSDGARLVALAGRSGSGKSTLCHLVAGLGRPRSGRILIGGQLAHEVDDWAVVSLLPQRLALIEELSVAENVLLPTVLADRRRPPADPELFLELLGLSAVAGRRCAQTSLGEQQRTALARALVLRPRLAVLDEPTGHQDDEHVHLVLNALTTACGQGTAVLVATHDDRVLDVADEVVRLHRGAITAQRPSAC